jgi:PST family polysaccharide transporter
MASDFYPRLTGVAKDNAECNRLVNEQARISLLLAGPGVLGTLTFAPLLILALYSKNFTPAVEVFRWICLGMALRVVAWLPLVPHAVCLLIGRFWLYWRMET